VASGPPSFSPAPPELVDAILQAGHDIGCHTQDHLNHWRVRPAQAIADIRAGYRTLAEWVPSDGLFRPPYGKLTLDTWAALRRRRAPIAWWTITAGDVRRVLPQPHDAARQAQRHGGGVVLLHDSHRQRRRAEFVLESTETLLDAAAHEGYTVRTFRALMHAGAHRAC
jgi:peptidoglycan/xylan/chitin deacetylase (PgdA/CDA1 family)